jgi:hypothetical protein
MATLQIRQLFRQIGQYVGLELSYYGYKYT